MIRRIPLNGRVSSGASLDFIAVEVPFEPDRYIPFALVRYAIDGKEQPEALRLDLDKGTFGDHFPHFEREQILTLAGKQIVTIVAEALRSWTYERLRKQFGES